MINKITMLVWKKAFFNIVIYEEEWDSPILHFHVPTKVHNSAVVGLKATPHVLNIILLHYLFCIVVKQHICKFMDNNDNYI